MERGWVRVGLRALATGLGVLLLLVGALLAYAGGAVVDESGFVRRIEHSLGDPRVSGLVAEEIVDGLIQEKPDLVAVRPLLLGTVEAVLSSRAAQTVVGTGARAVHHLLFTETGEDILFTLDDVQVLVRSTLEQSHPALAERLPEKLSASLQERLAAGASSRIIARSVRAARLSGRWGFPLFLGGVLLVAAGAFTAPPMSRGFVRLGVVLVAVALSLGLVRRVGGYVLSFLVGDPELSRAIAGLWGAFMAGLGGWSLALGGAGALLIAVPLGVALRAGGLPVLRGAWAWLRRPREGALERGVRASILVLAGLALLLEPGRVLSVLAAALGAAVGFAGLVEGFAVLLLHVRGVDWLATGELLGHIRAQLRLGAAIVLATGVALGVTALAVLPPRNRVFFDANACNGSPELCSVPLDRVVFPTTHNSMAAGDEAGWMIPNHEVGIGPQLEDGIRGLMIDVYYGFPTKGRVLTELEDEARARAAYEQVVGREGVDAALRIRGRLLGEPRGERGLYLCHGFCELGATPLEDGLRTIERFLGRHPQEVLVVVVQDHPVDPRDMARAVEDVGLLEVVYRDPPGPPWPPLRELIERDQRVLFLSEARGGVVPWYHAAYTGLLEETPYHFEDPEQFSCKPFRGGDRGALFLLNHWITAPPAPLPSRAAVVNSRPFLLERVHACERVRGRVPNLLAVDFYRTGDLFQVARLLNRRATGQLERRVTGAW